MDQEKVKNVWTRFLRRDHRVAGFDATPSTAKALSTSLLTATGRPLPMQANATKESASGRRANRH
jgi:hypothetical protein